MFVRFSNGVLELFEELTSQTEKLDLMNLKEITGRLTQEYVDRFRALLEQAGQEVNEVELREAVSDLLDLFAGNHDKELLKRRIEFGRKLGATEIPMEQLIKIYGSLFERWCDELALVYQFSKKELQSLDLCQYSRHILSNKLCRFFSHIFTQLRCNITNSTMYSFSIIPRLYILKYS